MSSDDKPDATGEPDPSLPSEKEFGELLHSIGWGTAYSRAPLPDAPPEPEAAEPAPPEPAAPAPQPGATRKPRRLRRRIAMVLLGILVIAILDVVLLFFLESPLRNFLPAKSQTADSRLSGEYEAQKELFEEFVGDRLTPGMTAEQLRDEMGLPVMRGPGSSADRQVWYYLFELPGGSEHRQYYIIELENNRYAQLSWSTEPRAPDHKAIEFQPILPILSVNLTAILPDGRSQNLSGSDPYVVLIYRPKDAASIPEGLTLRTLPVERLEQAHGKEIVDFQSPSLYWKGVLCPLPVWRGEPRPDLLESDLKWLRSRLGYDTSGNLPRRSDGFAPVKRNARHPR